MLLFGYQTIAFEAILKGDVIRIKIIILNMLLSYIHISLSNIPGVIMMLDPFCVLSSAENNKTLLIVAGGCSCPF